MARIIELGEASGISDDDYVMIDHGTNGTRKYKAKSLMGKVATKTITQNGTYNASSDNVDGYSSVKVSVYAGQPVFIDKTITENGIYNASSDNADGYSSVTVDVQGSSIDFILDDVTIATPSQSPYTVTLDGTLPIGLYMMSTLIVEENKIINQLINYTGGSLSVPVNGNACIYTVSFTGQDVPNTQIQSTCTWGTWKTLKCKLSAINSSQIY